MADLEHTDPDVKAEAKAEKADAKMPAAKQAAAARKGAAPRTAAARTAPRNAAARNAAASRNAAPASAAAKETAAGAVDRRGSDLAVKQDAIDRSADELGKAQVGGDHTAVGKAQANQDKARADYAETNTKAATAAREKAQEARAKADEANAAAVLLEREADRQDDLAGAAPRLSVVGKTYVTLHHMERGVPGTFGGPTMYEPGDEVTFVKGEEEHVANLLEAHAIAPKGRHEAALEQADDARRATAAQFNP